MASSERAQWSSFWQQGFITTFGRSKPANYDGVVRDFWREKFVDLPVGARILDIATGNGAIAMLAAEVNGERGKGFAIAATDLAEINRSLLVKEEMRQLRDSIEFHSRTPCEKQPFDDDHFNFVSSQFGFEYSNIAQTIPELHRILVTGGQFVAISHHTESELIKAAKVELEVYEYALDSLEMFANVCEYFDALGDISDSPKKVAARLKKLQPMTRRINESVASLRQRFPNEECAHEIISAIGYLARGARRATEHERRDAVSAAATDFGFAQARLRDMVGAALDREDTELLAVTAKEAGFDSVISLNLYGDDGGLAGWQIHIQ